VIGGQIANLTLNPSFGHNLCLKCPNGSFKPILDIYVLRYFPLYKELFNLMGFDLCNCSLKIWESMGTLTPKVRVHLGVWRFIPESMRCDSRASFSTCNLASPCLGHEPKVRVAIFEHHIKQLISNLFIPYFYYTKVFEIL